MIRCNGYDSYLSNALRGITEGEAIPWQVVSLHALEIYNVLLTRSTRHPTKRLLCEHGIIFILSTLVSHGHNQIIEVLDLLLQ